MPLEYQKHLGYFLWTMSHASRLLTEGKNDQAHLLLWRATASVEQSILDSHWRTAWGISGLQEPPFQSWEGTSAASHRRVHPVSHLLPEPWVSTAIAKVRDEKFLRDQRDAPQSVRRVEQAETGAQDGDAAARGRGRGRGR